jgi:protein-L-isoaspartate(D-aspartate) O-methyltransferase
MVRDEELAIVRRAYAKQTLAQVQIDDPRLELAFATVRREDFLGPGPWVIPRWLGGRVPTPSADPVYLYIDGVVQIIAERRLNNGQPSGHARWIASACIEDGDHVVHVGTGTGYYTAIMALLAGPSGKVTGIEIDPGLAARSRANLSSFANVQVIEGDGAVAPFETANVIYVNAGATRPADAWLDGLAEGGRLILPLTTDGGFLHLPQTPNRGSLSKHGSEPIEKHGAMFRIERRARNFLAQWITPVAIIPCESCRDAESEAALSAAFGKGGWEKVTRLYRQDDIPEDRIWLRAPGWCLSYA